MKIKQLSTVAVHTITDASNAMVSTIVVQVEGITADSGSMVPMQRISMSGVPGTAPTRRNCIYTNKDTGAPVAAGTPITADGFYEFDGSGAEIYMNVTAVTAGFTCYITPLEGPSGSGAGGGGVSEAVTLAANSVSPNAFQVGSMPAGTSADEAALLTLLGTTDNDSGNNAIRVSIAADLTTPPTNPLQVQVRDNTAAFTMPTGDAAARAIFEKITDGTNTTAVKAASAAPVATDPALVVAVSPNSPIAFATGSAVKVTDGTNFLPTGDAAARAIFEKITDGTTTAGVDASSTGLKVAIAADLTTAPVADTTLLASAARTTTQASSDQTNNTNKGIFIIVDVTSAGTGSITMTINGKDPASGKYYLLLSGAAITTNSTNVYRVFPAATASANAVANDQLPHIFQIVITANNANTMTYSVGYTLTV